MNTSTIFVDVFIQQHSHHFQGVKGHTKVQGANTVYVRWVGFHLAQLYNVVCGQISLRKFSSRYLARASKTTQVACCSHRHLEFYTKFNGGLAYALSPVNERGTSTTHT